jgi:hypothetical protein
MSNPHPSGDGLETVDSIELPRPLVDASQHGAAELGRWYWNEVERSTRRLVTARTADEGIRLVLGGSLTLLRFGAPVVTVDADVVECRYPIVGGHLAARPGGSLAITQRVGRVPQLEIRVSGYHPRLAGTGTGLHRGLLYRALQAPLHRTLSRRSLTRAATRRSP